MAATGQTSAGDNSALVAGYEAYQRGDVRGALALFEQVSASETGRVRCASLINAASMADELGEHVRAVELYRTALAELPEDGAHQRPAALVNLSQALQHLGDLAGAEGALREARELLVADSTLPNHGLMLVSCLLSLTAVALHRQEWAEASAVAAESLSATEQFAPQLIGHPLMNLAASSFETGRVELALDFANQAVAAFAQLGDPTALAEAQQNLAIMFVRANRLDDAEPPLLASQEFFTSTGLAHRAGIGAKTIGFLAERRGDLVGAGAQYTDALAGFTEAGALIEAADVRLRLATVRFATGNVAGAEALLAESFATYEAHGLGLHCAQLDYWHAELLYAASEFDGGAALGNGGGAVGDAAANPQAATQANAAAGARTQMPAPQVTASGGPLAGVVNPNASARGGYGSLQDGGAERVGEREAAGVGNRVTGEHRTPEHGARVEGRSVKRADHGRDSRDLARIAALAVPAALALDAVRHTLPNGNQRVHWHREIAGPAMQLAFQTAVAIGDGQLVADLVETQCAGTGLDLTRESGLVPRQLPYQLIDPPTTSTEPGTTWQLGNALADVAVAAGIPVSPPAHISDAGRILLADYISHTEQRYSRQVRDTRVLPC
ncbi:tetratricopeptide repeat protein [Nocardia camponoti]|uniref:Tetratricopeptide repeat protein n=1 Tax=Nocardia camponoti TaxID=1616106 RepID=A0A917QJH2_9NOCA|nr:hypothetical protein [Nocardia camponoti]GGK53485.1 hypothetical protein GCM10011591_26650 [Nocardia camponoti]